MSELEYLSMKLNWNEAKILKKKNSQGLQRCLLKKQEVMNKFDEIKNIDSDIEYNSSYKIHSPDR